jgi:DNA-directed RNA polymerase subunit alpha
MEHKMASNELMRMNWQEMIRPEKIESTGSTSYGKFVCEPLERGFGTTIGNALRRIILSSLYGAAIVSVKFEDVMHEFSVIPGVLEDMSELILNLKEVRLKLPDPNPRTVFIDAKGEGVVTAGDIQSDQGQVEILNPDLHLATLSENAEFKMTMAVHVGKGYSLSEANKDEEAPLGTIPIDAVFSPIKRVVYVVGNARVGQRTDYDKLTLEVWTDGSIQPVDAVAYGAKILKEQMSPFINFDEDLIPEPQKAREEKETPQFNDNLYRSVDELELSVRSANCLKNANIHQIFQLVSKSEGEMLKTKNFGRKSLNEIKEVLGEMDLALGMKLEGFTPPEEDVEQGE